MPMTDFLVPEFDHEMAVTRRVLERVPMADAAWKPHEKSFSLGQLATHVAMLPTWMGPTLRDTALDLALPENQQRPPVPTESAALLALFDTHVSTARQVLAGVSDAELMVPWSLRMGDHVIFTMPRAAVLRSFILSHVIHHRGQLTVYLRLRDVPVPSVYGPSADEQ